MIKKCVVCGGEFEDPPSHKKKSCSPKCLEALRLKSARYSVKKGVRYNNLTTIRATDKRKNGSVVWLCKCDCGKLTEVRAQSLITGNTKGCGCLSHLSAKARESALASSFVDGANVNLIRNAEKPSRVNASGIRGVFKSKGRWGAVLTFKGKKYYSKAFDNIEDAVKARKELVDEHFKPFLDELDKKSAPKS